MYYKALLDGAGGRFLWKWVDAQAPSMIVAIFVAAAIVVKRYYHLCTTLQFFVIPSSYLEKQDDSYLAGFHASEVLGGLTPFKYTLAQEHGDLINLHDWYQSFKSTVFQPSTKGKHKLKQSPAKKRKDTNESQNQSEASIQYPIPFPFCIAFFTFIGLVTMMQTS
ncbi:hypothetical protein CK203_030408 [Vitis vinifera]|uniref:Origin recognition complex subunit 3 winged helix C-terminal domain-containing protein n=1 Tax=Vitis vinifera TaxID=29760 RepID=A0A438IW01_VITVI|nr:hypothetical protein CK203_030408 [Vitis vinifera]